MMTRLSALLKAAKRSDTARQTPFENLGTDRRRSSRNTGVPWDIIIGAIVVLAFWIGLLTLLGK